MKSGSVLISLMFASSNPDLLSSYVKQKISAFSLDAIPHFIGSEYGCFSSQANLAGYKAVILGGAEMGKIFPMLMTSAGTSSHLLL